MRKLKGIIINGEYLGNKVAYSGLFKAIYCISPIIIAEFIKLVSDYGTRYAPLRITGFDLPEDHRILIRFANKKCRGYADLSFVVENYKLKLVDSDVQVESLVPEKSVVEEVEEVQDDIAQGVLEPEVEEPEFEQDIEEVLEDEPDEVVEAIEETQETAEETEEIATEEPVEEEPENEDLKEPETVAVVVPMPEMQEENVEETVEETEGVMPEEPIENNEDEELSDETTESIEEQIPVDESAVEEDCETEEEAVVDDNMPNELQEELTNEDSLGENLDDVENETDVSDGIKQDFDDEATEQQEYVQNLDESIDDNSEGVQDFNEEFDETNENLLDECSENFAEVENSNVEDSSDNNASNSLAYDEQEFPSEDYIESENSTVSEDVYNVESNAYEPSDYTESNQNPVIEDDYANGAIDVETPSDIESDCEPNYDEIVEEEQTTQSTEEEDNGPIEVSKIVLAESKPSEENEPIKTIDASRLAPETLAEIQDMLSASMKKKEVPKATKATNKKSQESIKMVAHSRNKEYRPFKMFQKGKRSKVTVIDENSFLVGDTIYKWGDVFYVDG